MVARKPSRARRARVSRGFTTRRSVRTGTSLTALTVIERVSVSVLTPPLAVPPLSCRTSVIVATPFWFAAGVYVRTPVEETAGPALNRPGFVLPVMRSPLQPAASLQHGLRLLLACPEISLRGFDIQLADLGRVASEGARRGRDGRDGTR